MTDAVRNIVREKFARDEVVASMTVRLVRTVEIARIARAAGFDTLYVDMEHSSLSFDTTGQICMAAQDCGVTPFVRVPSLRADDIARVLDGGAMGVIAPHVRTAEEARGVVEAARFPPRGHRSASGGLPHFDFAAVPAAQANPMLDAATMVVPMVETVEALENVEDIAGVDGVDMLLIGSNDLTAEMGIHGQYDHPRLRDAFLRVIAACRSRGKHVGVGGLAARPDLVAEFVRLGARYVSTGTDLAFLAGAAAARAKQVREIRLP